MRRPWLRRLHSKVLSVAADAAAPDGPPSDLQIIENRRFGVTVSIAQNGVAAFCWRFPGAYMNWSAPYPTADEAVAAAQAFATERQVPISLW